MHKKKKLPLNYRALSLQRDFSHFMCSREDFYNEVRHAQKGNQYTYILDMVLLNKELLIRSFEENINF